MDDCIENLNDCHIDDNHESSGDHINRGSDSFDDSELPSVIIVTGVPDIVFDSDDAKVSNLVVSLPPFQPMDRCNK